MLHDADDRRVFDSIIVVTDRRVLDRQIQRTIRQFEQTVGIVENIDQTSRQLKEALEAGKTIIVSTLQKFPVIAAGMGELPGTRFAVIVDEAHSSQSGESTKSLKQVLAVDTLEEAEQEDTSAEEDLDDLIADEMRARGPLPNVSTFAFTATPKQKTLELFGRKGLSGFEPFSLYSMRQAIEEGFILDVLQNYTTYKVYWSLLKRVQDDPHYDREKASYLLRIVRRTIVDDQDSHIDAILLKRTLHAASQIASVVVAGDNYINPNHGTVLAANEVCCLAGFPFTIAPLGTSRVTTAPIPTSASSPIRSRCFTTDLEPI